MPPELRKNRRQVPGLKVKTAGDSGTSDKPGTRYILRWETLEANRDKPRTGPLPEPSMLRVYRVMTAEPSHQRNGL